MWDKVSVESSTKMVEKIDQIVRLSIRWVAIVYTSGILRALEKTLVSTLVPAPETLKTLSNLDIDILQ